MRRSYSTHRTGNHSARDPNRNRNSGRVDSCLASCRREVRVSQRNRLGAGHRWGGRARVCRPRTGFRRAVSGECSCSAAVGWAAPLWARQLQYCRSSVWRALFGRCSDLRGANAVETSLSLARMPASTRIEQITWSGGLGRRRRERRWMVRLSMFGVLRGWRIRRAGD